MDQAHYRITLENKLYTLETCIGPVQLRFDREGLPYSVIAAGMTREQLGKTIPDCSREACMFVDLLMPKHRQIELSYTRE